MDRLRSRRRRRREDLEEELRLLASYRGQTVTKTVRGMMYYRKALELQAKDEGASQNFVMITSKTCVQIPESAFPKRERQSQWTVPDTELRKSLRLAVAEVLLPAYRSFLKLFGPLVESGKNSQRYIKYTAEDLERLLDELFEGKSMNEPRRVNNSCLFVCIFLSDECVEDGAIQREEVRRECGKGVTSSKALCGHMACHFEREKRVSCSHFFQVKKSVKSSVISH
ncbi:unnamed protein product [Brassica oleracea var. botrytis]